ncbi:hypothetical protein L2E82_26273 [Cichorium intybus]|uniref:Uncharacterized protein n=1 Tax=Cichorium intybus TaxID=13427 RepID=A0ACB9E5B5_CICIN|nr:hypothetical protein L2E82_26273 [Cichorium intybus]
MLPSLSLVIQLPAEFEVEIPYRRLMPTDKCATMISDSFCERVDLEGYRWTAVSDNIKEFYWDEFKENFFWEEQDNKK